MCLLCGDMAQSRLGAFLPSIHCHQLCIKFASGLPKNKDMIPKDVEIVREVKRSRKLTCVYCKRKGASVNCNGEECSRSYHLGCGMTRGVLNRHSDCSSYCSAHLPFPTLTCPLPRPNCPLCSSTVGQDLISCPACSVYIDRGCLETRASSGVTTCPNCGDSTAFRELSERFGIWFRDPTVEAVLVKAGSGAPSQTITYLVQDRLNSHSPTTPMLVTNKFSPMQQHQAAKKAPRIKQPHVSPMRPLRCDEPIVTLTANRSPTKSVETPSLINSDCDVISLNRSQEKGWLSTPVVTSTRKIVTVPRKSKSLPGKVPGLNKYPNHPKISAFFKPVSKPSSEGVDSDIDIVKQIDEIAKPVDKSSTEDLLSEEVKVEPAGDSTPTTVASTQVKPMSPPFKSMRMCLASSPVKTKAKRPVAIEFSSDAGTEGPLSDIDDILSGSVPDIQDHPLGDIVFRKSNPHLKKIMKMMKSEVEDEVVGEDIIAEGVSKEVEMTTEKESKKAKKKPKAPGLKKLSKKVESESDTSRKMPKVRKMPLSSRQIYHARNWVAMSEFGEEEEECEYGWIVDFTGRKLDDIVDLNSGERTMMDLWNKHVNKYQGRGIRHMDIIVKDFLTERSHTIVELNLYRNFITHMSGLHYINAITSETLYTCINDIQDVMKVLDQTKSVVGPSWVDQRERALEAHVKNIGESISEHESTITPSRMVRSAGRGRLNSNPRTGCSSPSHCGSPSRGPAVSSPSCRGRRPNNLNKNVQKSLDFDHKFGPKELFPGICGETTPGKGAVNCNRGVTMSPGRAMASDSSGETSCSEGGAEVASFLSQSDKLGNFMEATILSKVDTDRIVDEATIHVLTEEHDSEREDELDDCSDLEVMREMENEETEVVDKGHLQVYEKNFIDIQMEEYVRIRAVAKEKNIDSSKVLIINIGDDMAESIEDRLVVPPSKESLRIAGLKKLYKKHQAKRKKVDKSSDASKRIKLDGGSKDST